MRILTSFIFIFFSFPLFSQAFLWEEQNSGTTTPLNSVSAYNNNNVWICGNSSLVLRTTNGGLDWISATGNISPGISMVSIAAINENTAVVLGNCETGCIWKTSNGGLSWTETLVLTGNGHFRAIQKRNSNPNECFILGDPVGGRWSLWKSTNAGSSWDSTGMCILNASGLQGFDNCLTVIDSKIWFNTYVPSFSRMYYSANYGLSWQYYDIPEPCITAHWINNYGNDAEQLAGGINLKYTTNSGNSWSSLPAPGAGGFNGFSTFGTITDGIYNSNMWYIKYDNKIYWSQSNLQNFVIIHTAASGSYKHISKAVPNIWAVRHNGGISRCVIYVGVQNISSEIPVRYNLRQNYPNPFNPVTTIEYSIPEECNVELNVYNLIGVKVKTLVNQFQKAGSYRIDFDGKNLPSGVYTYRLIAGNFIETKKMILVK